MTRLILAGALAAVIVIAVAATAFRAKFLSVLRKNHPEQWRKLGAPSLFKSGSIEDSSAFQRFLKEKKFAELGDGKLSRAAAGFQFADRLYSAVFIAAIAIFIWNIYFLPHLQGR
ncbi:MAG: hypothetical protein KGL04_11170 [Elusimicrobia bacterium]|nr:hypothetical protein [Elusimicrobiota bacterium]